MADSLDNKENKNAGKLPNGADLDNAELLKLRHNIVKEIKPDLYSDVDGKDPKTTSP